MYAMEYYGAVNKNEEVLYVLGKNGLQSIWSYKQTNKKTGNETNCVNRCSLCERMEKGLGQKLHDICFLYILNHASIAYLIQ